MIILLLVAMPSSMRSEKEMWGGSLLFTLTLD
jgi:hypothetical protein